MYVLDFFLQAFETKFNLGLNPQTGSKYDVHFTVTINCIIILLFLYAYIFLYIYIYLYIYILTIAFR